MVIGWRERFTEVYRIFRTSLFAQPAKNTAQHVYLIFCCILLFFIKMFFAWFSLCGFHGDRFCRTCNSAKSACSTLLASFFIPVQYLQSAKDRTERPRLFGITDRRILFKNMAECNEHAFEYGRQIQLLPEVHWFS